MIKQKSDRIKPYSQIDNSVILYGLVGMEEESLDFVNTSEASVQFNMSPFLH